MHPALTNTSLQRLHWWSRAGGTVVVLVLALGACATGSQQSLDEPTGTQSPGPSPPSQGADWHGPSIDTFDSTIAWLGYVFVGTLTEIVDAEPWPAESRGPDRAYRELSFIVRDLIAGDLREGEHVPVLQNEIFGPAARLSTDDIGRDVLVVAQLMPAIRALDGQRHYEDILSLIGGASYVKMSDPDGRAVGVRLASPVAERFGYDGARATLEKRLSRRLPLRLADVSPWEDLLERAANPREVFEEQLGHEELQQTTSEPARYEYGG